ncbi:hypothetical protein ACPUEX_22360 [Enterobacter vonholyi]
MSIDMNEKIESTLKNLRSDSVVVVCGNKSSGKTSFLKEICEKKGIILSNPSVSDFVIKRIVKSNTGIAIDEAEDFIERNKHNNFHDGMYFLSLQDNRDNNNNEIIFKLMMIDKIFGKNRINLVYLK